MLKFHKITNVSIILLQFFMIILLIVFLTRDQVLPIIYTNFESGSIGRVTQYNAHHFNLALRDDNEDPRLPNKWRSWWYVKVYDEKNQTGEIDIDISHLGWNNLMIPFYSYDNQTWYRVDEEKVKQSPECDWGTKHCVLSFSQPLQDNSVYLASFIPYTVTQLKKYLEKISQHDAVQIETLGFSSHYHLPIQQVIITNPHSTSQTARVWIHARTHPGETPSSFMLEGLINFLLSEDPVALKLREKIIFHIIPMHNPDGVLAGNYRSNPDGINLELAWSFDKNNPSELTIDAPLENHLLNQVMQSLLTADIPVKMALNLHASHSEPDDPAFTFPHFSDNANKYSPEQIDLWKNQLVLMKYTRNFYEDRVEVPGRGSSKFLNLYHPETWWWYNARNQVLAMTFEATYGKAGYDYWITDVEHRALGESLAKGIAAYFELF